MIRMVGGLIIMIKCKCGSKKIVETITSGMVQTVLWDGDFIVSETTTFEKSDKHSSFRCPDCGADV
jgi:hypothetical protein